MRGFTNQNSIVTTKFLNQNGFVYAAGDFYLSLSVSRGEEETLKLGLLPYRHI